MHKPVSVRAAGASLESLESRLVLSAGAAAAPLDLAAATGPVTALEEPAVRPAAPTGLEATLTAPRAVVLEWNDVAGETHYKVERRVDGTTEPWAVVGETDANVTRFAEDGLGAGKTYLYRVRAVNGGGASEPSNVDWVTVEGETEPQVPAAPRLNAFRVADFAVALEWTNVANEAGYKLERRVDGSAIAFQQFVSLDANVNRYVDDGLEGGKTYLYRVRAFNEQGNSAYSNTVAVAIPGDGVPDAPRELVAELVQGRFVRLRWLDVAGEAGYKIERRFEGSGSGDWVQIGGTAANVVTFADERIERGRTYVYRVRAFNEAGPSTYSNTVAVSVPAEAPVPGTPGELNAELTDARRVRITWNNVAGERGYKVERRVDGTADWLQIGTTGENVTSFVDERVEGGKTYVYRVRAFNDVGNSSYSNTDAVRVPGEANTPAAPRVEVRLVAPRAAKVSWTNVAGETGYKVERRIDGSPEAWRVIREVGADVTTITEDGLEPGKTYLYRVRAFNAAGASPYSNVGFVTVPREGLPTAPRELRAIAGAARVDLKWVDAAGETGYRIERRVDGTSEWVKVGAAPAGATGFVDAKVAAGTTYIYRVRAYNDVGNSPWSNSAAAKVGGEGTVPAAPRLEARLIAPRAAKVAWTNVAGETGYKVERKVDGSGDTWRVVREVRADVTSVTEDGLDLGKTYLYRVRAFNTAGSSAYSNVVAVTTAGEVVRPAAPRELRAVAVSPTRIDLTWIGVDGETGYRIERRLDGSSTWEKVTFAAANTLRYSDAKVQPGKTYVYRIRAAAGEVASAWSNTAAAKTPALEIEAVFSTRRIVFG